MGGVVLVSYWLRIYQAYVCYSSVSVNNIAFLSQKCAGWDAHSRVSYGHSTYGRVHHTPFSCPAPPPLEFWERHPAQAFFDQGTTLSHCLLELWAHS